MIRAGWQWAGVEGPTELIGPDDPYDGFDAERVRAAPPRDLHRARAGAHDDWDEYDRVMAEERRVAVLVAPDRVYSNG